MKDVSYYRSIGFEEKMAKYFASGRKKIIQVIPNEDYTLDLLFDNQEWRQFDCKALIQKGTVFEALANMDVFHKVYLDETHNVCWDRDANVDSKAHWNNKIDLDSDSCYVDSVPKETINT